MSAGGGHPAARASHACGIMALAVPQCSRLDPFPPIDILRTLTFMADKPPPVLARMAAAASPPSRVGEVVIASYAASSWVVYPVDPQFDKIAAEFLARLIRYDAHSHPR